MSRSLARQLARMGIRDPRVLEAVERVPRERFVPPALRQAAEEDRPLPIGHGQTISQPFIAAFMTEALRLSGSERVLEVGTGSGYQTALLAILSRRVYSIEIVAELAAAAESALREVTRIENVELRVGDGRLGWPEEAPFDRILVTAAPAKVPEALVEQLAPCGRMVIPIGPDSGIQQLTLLERTGNGADRLVALLPVRFVPLTGGGS